jgi:mitogen-activated protein kinase 1/3
LVQTRQARLDLDRDLTSHVATRFYRAPELILMEKDYGKEVDVWAAGVIFGELMYTLEANCPDFCNRKCLFPGKYCFPLSPNQKADIDEMGIPLSQRNDSLELIFDLIGTPTADDCSFVTDVKALHYLRQFRARPQVNLREVYPTGSDDALRLISSMLQFNPYFRPTVDELLSDDYFSDVRQFSQAYDAPSKIVFDFENTLMDK